MADLLKRSKIEIHRVCYFYVSLKKCVVFKIIIRVVINYY
jgi:hypothetical protein